MFYSHNKSETNISTPIQQGQGSIQAQEILLSALPQHEQNVTALQLQSKQNLRKLINGLLISIVFIFIIVANTVWLLNIAGIIKGPWENIFIALFTSLGMLLAIVQIYFQVKEERTLAIKITIDSNKATAID